MKLERTDAAITESEMRVLIDAEESDALDYTIQVCEGAWIRENDGRYRFWRDPDFDPEF